MSTIGTLESLHRYPVKSMAGETVDQAFVAFAGIMGDRVWGFTTPAGPDYFPWHTAREQEDLLLHRPRFRHPERVTLPPHLDAAEKIPPAGVNPFYPDDADFAVTVRAPNGAEFDVTDPALLERLQQRSKHRVQLLFTQKGQPDCRPVSLLSMNSIDAMSQALGMPVDARRFRANLYVRWNAPESGFFENELIDRRIRIGERFEMLITERDQRCKMIAFDPDTAQVTREVMQHVARQHGGKMGVYGAVLREGRIRVGDAITLVGGSA